VSYPFISLLFSFFVSIFFSSFIHGVFRIHVCVCLFSILYCGCFSFFKGGSVTVMTSPLLPFFPLILCLIFISSFRWIIIGLLFWLNRSRFFFSLSASIPSSLVLSLSLPLFVCFSQFYYPSALSLLFYIYIKENNHSHSPTLYPTLKKFVLEKGFPYV